MPRGENGETFSMRAPNINKFHMNLINLKQNHTFLTKRQTEMRAAKQNHVHPFEPNCKNGPAHELEPLDQWCGKPSD